MQKKDLKFEIKTVGEDGTFEGLLSVYGVIDLGNDMVVKGAFTKTIQENKSTVPMLWQHDPHQPIGTLDLSDTEDGLHVKGKFLLEVKQAQEAYALVKAGVIRGLSIGFEAVKKEIKDGVRYLREIKLWEGSVVTFPMLPVAQITNVKGVKADFLTVLDEMQTFRMRGMMMNSICESLDSIAWDSNLSSEDKITASAESIQQFAESYVNFLPKLFTAWESYKSHGDIDKLIADLGAEFKAGRRNSAADETMLRQMISTIQALLGEEAAATSEGTEAGKGTSAAGAAPQPNPETAEALISQLNQTSAGISSAVQGVTSQWN